MKKLISIINNKIFLWLGYMPIADTAKIVNNIFKEPDCKPSRERGENEPWNDYWQKEYQPHYLVYYMRNLSLYPEVLHSLIYEMAQFDWNRVHKFMEENNWYWNNRKRSPNYQELYMAVISLAHTCIKGDYANTGTNTVSSGGFEVTVDKGKVSIEFDFNLIY